jgi:UPF0716 protein FxsA
MSRILGFFLLLLPLVEIAGFVLIGGELGVGLTLAWVLVAAMVGLALIRKGGLSALMRLDEALRQGREPGSSLIDGAVFVLAGLLLVLPGFVGDALAVLLILPPTRHFLLRRMASHFETRVYRRSHGAGGAKGSSTIIEGEFTETGTESAKSDGLLEDRRQ